ncbi:MAG: hypothetical protein C4532_12765 [Candidatus Abyssobacteria bacterium SURF_17]|uniref:Glycosyltransferase RgtA/B/C/D-like domain-containing protein n=1 Tax=Candidatus Abyssobacteria bacterium SURF_17 TaxID=2093361 RepID=A0A419EVS7_9BACT|nr:MAG: hypothetical protein C4532_12765 [Candidatus Abyssubacteria bacterium SURF_17]
MTLAFGAHALHYSYSTDDAFITFRYVRNLLAGHGLVYNPGERAEGYTNFLWAMLLAGAAITGADIVQSARILGFLSSAGTIVLVTIMANRFLTRRYAGKAHSALSLVPGALLAANGSFAMWTLGGLETALFTFLLVLITFVYLDARHARAMHVCGLLFALLIMTRPDGVVFLAATAAHIIVGPIRSSPDSSIKRRVGLFMRLLTVCLAVFLPYFVWRYSYYGYPLPNTFYAKVAGGTASIVRGIRYAWFFVADYGLVPIAAAAVFFYARMFQTADGEGRRRVIGFESSFLLLQIAACVGFVLYVGGDQLVMHRFFVAIFPAMYLLSVMGLSELLRLRESVETQGAASHWRIGLVAACAAAVAVTAAPSFFGREHHRVFDVEKPADADRMKVGKWLKNTVDSDTTIALIPAGIIPYYSGLKTIDLVGLNDVHIAHTEVAEFGRGEAGHEKYNSAYVLGRKPDLVFLGACRIWPQKLPVEELLSYYWIYGVLAPGNREMLRLYDFRSRYVPCAARVDSGYVHFFKQRDYEMPSAEPLAAEPLALRD